MVATPHPALAFGRNRHQTPRGSGTGSVAAATFAKGAGLRLSSTSRSQYSDGPRLPISQLRAGDLVFWSSSSRTTTGIHHVALYVGDGRIVEADRVSGPDLRVRAFSTGETGVMPSVVRPIG